MRWNSLGITIARVFSCAFALCIAWMASIAFAQQRTVNVVEFYNASLNHYFISADESETQAIDNGAAGPGWSRTGQTFSAFSAPTNQPRSQGACVHARADDSKDTTGTPCEVLPQADAPVAGVAVCRFYALSSNSHFYTADEMECASLQSFERADRAKLEEGEVYQGWAFEGAAFYIETPNAQGSCAAGAVPVVRYFNNRHFNNDSNHRFLVGYRAKSMMEASGWSAEGVAFCAASGAMVTEVPKEMSAVECGLPFDTTKVARFEYRSLDADGTRTQNIESHAFTETVMDHGIEVRETIKKIDGPGSGDELYTLSPDRKFVQYHGWSWQENTTKWNYSLMPPERVATALIPGGPGLIHRSLERYSRKTAAGSEDPGTDWEGRVTLTTFFDRIEPISVAAGRYSDACVIRTVNVNVPFDGLKNEATVWRVRGVGNVFKREIGSQDGVELWRYEVELLGYE
jgi:hypothetical protein